LPRWSVSTGRVTEFVKRVSAEDVRIICMHLLAVVKGGVDLRHLP